MDWVALKKNGESFFKKYKFVLLIALLGLVLMMLPENKKESSSSKSVSREIFSLDDMERKLETQLSNVAGAGRVSVLLSLYQGEEYIYQSDLDGVGDGSGAIDQSDTIIISDSDRNETGLLRKVIYPKFSGAIVVCDGGDDANIKLLIVDAVSKMTGLGADKIAILKMK